MSWLAANPVCIRGELPNRDLGYPATIELHDRSLFTVYYCQDRALDRMLDAVKAARASTSSIPERLRIVLAAHLCTLLDDVEGATAHVQIESLPPARRAAIVKKRDRYEFALRRLIEDGVRTGDLVNMDPAIVARGMLGALNWTVTWFRPEGTHTAATIADVLSRFLLRGIASRSPAAKRTLALAADNE